MGGKIYTTNRVDANVYHKVSNKILNDAKILCFDITQKIAIIPSYRNKQTFGDIDILVVSKDKVEFIKRLTQEYRIDGFTQNSDTISIGFPLGLGEILQVDFIFVSEENFDSSYHYFSWNDVSNIIGRIFHKIGVKFAHDGVWVVCRDESYIIGKILLTKDLVDALDLIGLPKSQYTDGFDDIEDAYEWTTTSPYFNKYIYELDNRNATSRVRDMKRKVYTDFLIWLKGRDTTMYPFVDITERGGYNIREPFFTEIVCKKYPHAKVEYDKLVEEYDIKKKNTKVFNGDIVKDLIGLSGVELGRFMKFIRGNIDTTKLYLLTSSEVNDIIFDMFKKYNERVEDVKEVSN